MHMVETPSRKARHIQEEVTQWKAKGSKDSKDSKKITTTDKNKDSIECWNCGMRLRTKKDQTNKGWFKGQEQQQEHNGCSQS